MFYSVDDSDGFLNSQTCPSYVQCHTISKTRIQILFKKIRFGVNDGSAQRLLRKNHLKEILITLYNYLKL